MSTGIIVQVFFWATQSDGALTTLCSESVLFWNKTCTWTFQIHESIKLPLAWTNWAVSWLTLLLTLWNQDSNFRLTGTVLPKHIPATLPSAAGIFCDESLWGGQPYFGDSWSFTGFRCGLLILSLLEFQFENKILKTFESHVSGVKSSDGKHLFQSVWLLYRNRPLNVSGFSQRHPLSWFFWTG